MKHTYCIVGPSAGTNKTLADNLERLYGMKQGSDTSIIGPSEIVTTKEVAKNAVIVYLHSAGNPDYASVVEEADMIFRLSEKVKPEKLANLVYHEVCSFEIDAINETLCGVNKSFVPWVYMEWPDNADPDLPQFKWTEGDYTSKASYSLDETNDSAYAAAKYQAARTLLRIDAPSDDAMLLQSFGPRAIRARAEFCETEDIQIAKVFCELNKGVDLRRLSKGLDDFYDSHLTIEQMDAVDDAFFSFAFLRDKVNSAAH